MRLIGLLENVLKTGDGVFAVDPEQRIILWNRGAETILGYTNAEAVGQLCHELIQGKKETGQLSCVQGCPIIDCALKGGLTAGQNLFVKSKQGSPKWLSVTHMFTITGNDSLAAVVHIFRDITPEVEAKRLVGSIADQLSNYGRAQTQTGPLSGGGTGLTEREREVLALLSQGEGTGSIASNLEISNTTSRNHIQSILAKLGVHTRLEAVAYARRHRLLDPG